MRKLKITGHAKFVQSRNGKVIDRWEAKNLSGSSAPTNGATNTGSIIPTEKINTVCYKGAERQVA